MVLDGNDAEHIKAADPTDAVEARERQRAIEVIERGRKDGDPGMPFDDFLAFHKLPRRGDDRV